MSEHVSGLSSWESFYVIVGSSGGALIGLQFVVITLLADRRDMARAGALSAFGTPTVVHLAGALLVSAMMSAPWPSLALLSVALSSFGLGGLAYTAIVLRRARRQKDYEPVFEDWLWHAMLPCLSYAAVTVSALFLHAHPDLACFVIGSAALGLLFIGIHNAWDTVTHIVVTRLAPGATKSD